MLECFPLLLALDGHPCAIASRMIQCADRRRVAGKPADAPLEIVVQLERGRGSHGGLVDKRVVVPIATMNSVPPFVIDRAGWRPGSKAARWWGRPFEELVESGP